MLKNPSMFGAHTLNWLMHGGSCPAPVVFDPVCPPYGGGPCWPDPEPPIYYDPPIPPYWDPPIPPYEDPPIPPGWDVQLAVELNVYAQQFPIWHWLVEKQP